MGPFDSNPIQGYGGWNVTPAYMTPANMANFRPGYAGGDPRNPYARGDSLVKSAWTWGPGDIAYGADPLREFGAAQYNMTTAVGDAAVTGMQAVGIPAAAWLAASKINNMGIWSAGAGRALPLGMSHTLGSRISARMATGVATRMGMGAAASGLVGGAAGVAGGMFLPLAAGAALAGGIDSALIDPYVATRRGMDAMQANTTNSFIAGQGGAYGGGFGMSATRSFEISRALTEAGQRDKSLTGMDYNETADLMMRGGMFQEIGDMDTDRIVDGVKQGMSVLKMITRITGDPDIRNGVSTLAKLKMGGLDDISQMGRVLEQIRNASAASGTSVNQIIDTIGTQGMVMAQQYGMRGVTGLLASSDAYAGFTSARRAGVISGAQMQALGGAEGMTQNAIGAAMRAMSSPYGRMVMQGGGPFGGSLTGTIGRWGSGFSGNPMASMGDWFMNKGVYMDEALNKNGASNMTLKSLQAMARATGQDANDGRVLAAMAEGMGFSPEQFRSVAELDRANQDPRSRLYSGESANTASRADFAARLQQEGLGWAGIPILGNLQLGYRQAKSGLLGATSDVMSPVAKAAAKVSDWWEGSVASAKGLAMDQDRTQLVDLGNRKAYMQLESTETIMRKDPFTGKMVQMGTRETDKHNALLAKINRLKSNPNIPDDVKGSLDKAYSAIMRGMGSEASAILREVDRKTKGAISGSDVGYVQEAFFGDTAAAIDAGEIKAKVVNIDLSPPINANAYELDRALMSKDHKTIEKMINDGKVTKDQIMKRAGGKYKNLRDAVNSIGNSLLEKEYNIDVDNPNALAGTLSKFGVTSEELQNYRNAIGAKDDSAIVHDYRSDFMGIGDATLTGGKAQELAQKVKDVNKARGQDEASKIDWTGMKDVTQGMGMLGKATEINTGALIGLTDAVNANTRANGGTAPEISLPSNSRNPVVQGVDY